MFTNPSIVSPLSFHGEVTPESVGMTKNGVRNIVETFNRQLADGFHLGGTLNQDSDVPIGMGRKSSIRIFGHFGQDSCMAWADPDVDIAVAFTCNRLIDEKAANLRWQELSDAVWETLN